MDDNKQWLNLQRKVRKWIEKKDPSMVVLYLPKPTKKNPFPQLKTVGSERLKLFIENRDVRKAFVDSVQRMPAPLSCTAFSIKEEMPQLDLTVLEASMSWKRAKLSEVVKMYMLKKKDMTAGYWGVEELKPEFWPRDLPFRPPTTNKAVNDRILNKEEMDDIFTAYTEWRQVIKLMAPDPMSDVSEHEHSRNTDCTVDGGLATEDHKSRATDRSRDREGRATEDHKSRATDRSRDREGRATEDHKSRATDKSRDREGRATEDHKSRATDKSRDREGRATEDHKSRATDKSRDREGRATEDHKSRATDKSRDREGRATEDHKSRATDKSRDREGRATEDHKSRATDKSRDREGRATEDHKSRATDKSRDREGRATEDHKSRATDRSRDREGRATEDHKSRATDKSRDREGRATEDHKSRATDKSRDREGRATEDHKSRVTDKSRDREGRATENTSHGHKRKSDETDHMGGMSERTEQRFVKTKRCEELEEHLEDHFLKDLMKNIEHRGQISSLLTLKNGDIRYHVGGEVLQGRDLRTLTAANWLNDKVINAYLTLLQSEVNSAEKDHIYVLPSYLAVLWGNGSYNTWFYRNVHFSIFKWIFLPVNKNENHWILLAVHVPSKEVHVMDSLGGRNSKYVKQWRTFITLRSKETGEFKDIEWSMGDLWSSKQLDGNSCGAFVLMNALALTKDIPPHALSHNCSTVMRQYVLTVLTNSANRPPAQRTVCDMPGCNRPHKEMWIQCNVCGRWLHFSCVNLVKKPAASSEYVCTICHAQYE